MTKPIIILGGGGHASVLVDMLKQMKQTIAAIISPDLDESRHVFRGIEHLRDDDDIFAFDCGDVELVNGIGSLPGDALRKSIFQRFKRHEYKFKTIVSPTAMVSSYAELGEGVQIMANVVIQTGVKVFENSIVNTSSSIDHDCIIGSHNHIAPGVTLSGGVQTDKSVHIGSGANVIQNVHISEAAIVGAGTTITRDIDKGVTVYCSRNYFGAC